VGSAFSELLDQGSDGSDGKEQAEQQVSSADNAIIDLIITYLTGGLFRSIIYVDPVPSQVFDG
jgi:hypothetical protein